MQYCISRITFAKIPQTSKKTSCTPPCQTTSGHYTGTTWKTAGEFIFTTRKHHTAQGERHEIILQKGSRTSIILKLKSHGQKYRRISLSNITTCQSDAYTSHTLFYGKTVSHRFPVFRQRVPNCLSFSVPLRCNEYPNATQQDTNHAPTGIPSQEKGKNISFPQNDYRDVYRKEYRVVFLFHEKPKC
mgnify:CR=1 FL=1